MDTWFNAVQAVEVARSELDWSVLTRSKEVKTVVHAKPFVLFMIKTPGNVFHDKWYSDQSRFIYTTPRISLTEFKFNFFKSCSHNCRGHGICLKTSGKNQAGFQCTCNAGFFGKKCELYLGGCNVDGKSSQLCQNGGVCRDTKVPFGYKCDCPRGYVGVNCEKTVQSLLDALVRAEHK